MYYLTWALQIILAVKFISSAFIHAFRQDKPTLQYGIQKMGAEIETHPGGGLRAAGDRRGFSHPPPRVGLGRDDHRLCRRPRRAADAGIDRVSPEVPGNAKGVGECYDTDSLSCII